MKNATKEKFQKYDFGEGRRQSLQDTDPVKQAVSQNPKNHINIGQRDPEPRIPRGSTAPCPGKARTSGMRSPVPQGSGGQERSQAAVRGHPGPRTRPNAAVRGAGIPQPRRAAPARAPPLLSPGPAASGDSPPLAAVPVRDPPVPPWPSGTPQPTPVLSGTLSPAPRPAPRRAPGPAGDPPPRRPRGSPAVAGDTQRPPPGPERGCGVRVRGR